MRLYEFLPPSGVAQMFSLLSERGLVRLVRGEAPLKSPAGLGAEICSIFLESGKQDRSGELLPVCPNLTAHGCW